MTKNIKLLYIVIIILLFVVFVGVYVSFSPNLNIQNITKTDQQKWEEFKPILRKDSEAFNNWLVKDYQVAEKHYPIVKNINCEKLSDFSNQNNCKILRDMTIKRIERPEEVKGDPKWESSEYKSVISAGINF
jgi:hypothetical protein